MAIRREFLAERCTPEAAGAGPRAWEHSPLRVAPTRVFRRAVSWDQGASWPENDAAFIAADRPELLTRPAPAVTP